MFTQFKTNLDHYSRVKFPVIGSPVFPPVGTKVYVTPEWIGYCNSKCIPNYLVVYSHSITDGGVLIDLHYDSLTIESYKLSNKLNKLY